LWFHNPGFAVAAAVGPNGESGINEVLKKYKNINKNIYKNIYKNIK
jgi:hypothetical protein